MSKAKVFYILIVTLAGVFYLYRESINVYWAQTYHQESPLVGLERWTESHIADLTIFDFKIDEAAYKTEIISLDGIKGGDRIIDQERYQRHLAASVIAGENSGISTSEIETPSQEKTGSIETKYHYFETAFVGPLLPQLPQKVIVTAGDKLFFVGDSLMQGVAPRVRQSLYKSENIDGVDLSKQSTGLAYPRFYNWPEVVETTLNKDQDIKAVVVYLGANDPWDFPVPGRKQYLRFKSADWERAYRARVQKIILSAHKHTLPVIWLGAPCMRKDKLHQDMVYLNTIYQSEMAKFNGTYIPTSDLLGCSDEGYNAYVETADASLKVRTNDGIHFTPTGQRRIAERVIAELTIEREVIEALDENTLESSENEAATLVNDPAGGIQLISESQ